MQSAKAACVSASEAARAVEAATHAGDIVQALYKTSIAASRAATVRLRPTATGVSFVDAHVQTQACMLVTCPLRGTSAAGARFQFGSWTQGARHAAPLPTVRNSMRSFVCCRLPRWPRMQRALPALWVTPSEAL